MNKFSVEMNTKPTTLYNKTKDVYKQLADKLKSEEKPERFFAKGFAIPVSRI
mgnify:CR=1 FL=1